MASNHRIKDVSIQASPNYGSFSETYQSHIIDYKHFMFQAENEYLSVEEENQFSDILIKNVAIQSTTGEVTIYKTFPSLHTLLKMFELQIMPYYLSLKNKARMKVLQVVYGISNPPIHNNASIQVCPEDIQAMKEWMEEDVGFDLISTKKTDKGEETEFIKESVDDYLQDDVKCVSELSAFKEDASVQTSLDDLFVLEKDDSGILTTLHKKKLKYEDIIKDITEEKSSESVSDIDTSKLKYEECKDIERSVNMQSIDSILETKDLEYLKTFLLEKNVWDAVFWQVCKSMDDETVKTKLVSQHSYTLFTEEVTPSDQWIDTFMTDLVKKFSKEIHDILQNFKVQIKLRNQSMELYWELISSTHVHKCPPNATLDNWDAFFLNYKNADGENGAFEKNILESECLEIERKETSEKIHRVLQHVKNFRNLRKERQSPLKSKEKKIDFRLVQKDVLSVVETLHRMLCKKVKKITDIVKLKDLPLKEWLKIDEILNHDGTIYSYSELQEILPRLWIGDFSAIKTSCRLRSIQFLIVLGDCTKCFIDYHDSCPSLMPRPYIYKPPVFTVNGMVHQMNILAVDKATFPIFEYFRSACDYIDKSLSSSAKASIAVISRQGKSRSVAIVLAYLMFKKNFTLRKAVGQIKQKRAIRLNLGFLLQLIQCDRKIHRERKRPVTVRMKNAFDVRKGLFGGSYWIRDYPRVEKSLRPYIFLDDRFSCPDQRLGINANVFLHSPLSAPGPHFYSDVEQSIFKTPLCEMGALNDIFTNALRWDDDYPDQNDKVILSFNY
ncbi:dual specificity phosphatase DUPD1 [Nephila pilipes]|uniref:Dual specificity phosphatase DUPD1 n=1 Tax=Nephila pilipes TaxID=299642 RepID=A0A8X6QNQ3_NEPPI|nr:dual specificity phosphatase DUPD1 [Nephila pilipes]